MEKNFLKRMILATALLVACSFSYAEAAGQGRCPSAKALSVCPPDAEPCAQDSECAADRKCCESNCGGVCVEPLYTGCEQLERGARALGGVRAPRCTPSGAFERVQCDNEVAGTCWCVDGAGAEMAGTRARARSLVNCTAPAQCAAHTCRMLCPHGFALAADGCPLCRCRDPCAGVRCPPSHTCQPEARPCLEEPCPPVPTCKRGRSLENICPVGEPLLISDTHRPFLCGTDPGKPSCPPLYQCLVEKGNDYGVCCPASLKLEKPGSCPAPTAEEEDLEDGICGVLCSHDLECPSMQKCCQNDECGRHCVMPQNVTECLQQKMLAELLIINEREGRGYIPQCSETDGKFVPKQCSRNSLVCWCVDPEGQKLRGSMGPADNVDCSKYKLAEARSHGRSLAGHPCDRQICASVCEYGYKIDDDGCPSCECDDPCVGFTCPAGEECVRVKDQECNAGSGSLCSSYPICRPKISYVNPCQHDTPYTNDTTGEIINCDLNAETDIKCPNTHKCTAVSKSDQSVCCPKVDYDLVKAGLCPFDLNHMCGLNLTVACVADAECKGEGKCCQTGNCGSICVEPIKAALQEEDDDRMPTMCEYLRDFDEKMEGTHDGMRLALPQPECYTNGSFVAKQCSTKNETKECWCVDNFGTEIPKTRGTNDTVVDCVKIRTDIECLELTCRLGCDYGFILNEDTQCPSCQCRNPCQDVSCGVGKECQMVDVACDGDYCPPVPACLPRKVGQCPYLVPSLAGSCEFECHSDVNCNGTHRCCSNGCGTQCVEPVLKTACQHQQALALHKASEVGIPARQLWVPSCRATDGGFEAIQCHAAAAQCWCADESGAEVPGTRVSGGVMPQCQAPSLCPEVICGITCEHGYILDEDGCQTCDCKDPCADLTCGGENEICTVVRVECTSDPCPPVAMCLPSPGSPCGGSGQPLLAPGSRTQPLKCGPAAAACPSSHKCQLSPVAAIVGSEEAAVCCPKPRSVCFEPKDEGACIHSSAGVPNVTRWFFNPEKNKCEKFIYGGCSGNHNNFQTEQICNSVCPVNRPIPRTQMLDNIRQGNINLLSQCERLREKNQKAATRYHKQTFTPACDSETGKWMKVQCMHHIGVCWCVNAHGEPLKGSLVRGDQPDCNFRQARRWEARQPKQRNEADEVLEELIKQMTAYNFIDTIDDDESKVFVEYDNSKAEGSDAELNDLFSSRSEESETVVLKSRCLSMQEQYRGMTSNYKVACDGNGQFAPTQCEQTVEGTSKCWCVDEAGNQLSGTTTFKKGEHICMPTPINSIDVKLGFFGEYSGAAAELMKNQMLAELQKLGASIKDNKLEVLNDTQSTYMHFTVIGNNKIDVAYHLEQLVKEERISLNDDEESKVKMVADITRSQFQHNIGEADLNSDTEARILALQHREIVSESTVSVVTPYHTAIIVLAASSAFIISIMSVLIMLYKKKVSRLGEANVEKVSNLGERFLAYNPPIYVLSANEKADLAQAMKINEAESKDKV